MNASVNPFVSLPSSALSWSASTYLSQAADCDFSAGDAFQNVTKGVRKLIDAGFEILFVGEPAERSGCVYETVPGQWYESPWSVERVQLRRVSILAERDGRECEVIVSQRRALNGDGQVIRGRGTATKIEKRWL